MFWCWSYVWSYVLMLVLCSDALWPFLSVLLNICVCGSMIVCCTHSAAFCVYVWQTWTSTVMAKKSISWRSPPSRQCAILYSVVSYLLCVLLWITHGSLMISLTLTIWILWILWSDFFRASPVRQAFSCGGSLCVALWITHGGLMISVNLMIWIFLCSLVTDRPFHAVGVRQPVLLRWCRWWKRIGFLGQPAAETCRRTRWRVCICICKCACVTSVTFCLMVSS